MSIAKTIQKVVAYVKQVQDIALFATMADSRWYAAFGASPLFFVMLPFIGLLMTINALVNSYHLVQALNKNIDTWFSFIASALCAGLASISLYGGAISVFMGASFATGPWFFFSSLMVALTHQSLMLGINFYRAYESLPGSSQRMHHLQAALNNLFIFGLLAAITGSVVFIMLFPAVAPAVGVVCAMAAVGFTVLDILWRALPHNFKLAIKGALHLGKPDLTQVHPLSPIPTETLKKSHDVNPNQHRLFTRFVYSEQVNILDKEDASDYLIQIIEEKIQSYKPDAVAQNEKIAQKVSLLKCLLNSLTESTGVSRKDLLTEYPLAFQSFFVEKGEVEQIFDAFVAIQNKPVMDEDTELLSEISFA